MNPRYIAKKVCHAAVPLDFIDNDTVLCYRHSMLCKLNLSSNQLVKLCSIPNSKLRKIFNKSSILSRRFGLNEIKGIKVDNENYLIHYHRKFYVFNMVANELNEIGEQDMGGANGAILYISNTSYGVLIGDYGYNPKKKAMGIYRFIGQENRFEKIYQFDEGRINHIHNIVEDPVTHRLWIFTGDFDDSAAIYYTDDYFESVKCIGKGNQRYRGCIGHSFNNELFYATDSPLETNVLVHWYNGDFEDICEINGSCIYGSMDNQTMWFSTTVENQPDELNNQRNFYRYNLGHGIKDWYVELVKFNTVTKKTEIVVRIKKDIFPMLAFEYGCFRFPFSQNHTKQIICRGQAIKKYDNWLIAIQEQGAR